MRERTIDTMDYGEFQSLVDASIERSSQEHGEMPASVSLNSCLSVLLKT